MPGAPGLIVINYTPRPLKPAGATRIYIYGYGPQPVSNAVRQFPNPGNWTANNKIECLGPGGGGSGAPAADMNNAAGSGGGGGAYAFATNLYPTFPVNFNVSGSVGANQPFFEQQNSTWWNNFTQNAGNIIGRAGASGQSFAAQGSNSTPGAGGNLAYPAGFNGASGGAGSQNTTNTGTGGGGGGGAGGPNGAGAVGAANSGNVSGAGGASDGGHTPGSSSNGVSGTQWDHLHGVGGACAGGPDLTTLLTAGNFGGGGGGSFGSTAYLTTGGPAPLGTGGLIVITYTPRTATRIYLYPYSFPGVTLTRQFPNPGNWNPGNNKVECLGSGGPGVSGASGDIQGNAGAGGGGGGYSFDVNLSPTFPVSFQVIQGVASPNDDHASSTWWNNYTWGPGAVIGGYGYPATEFIGGSAGNTNPGAGGGTRSGQGSGNSTNYPAANSAVGGAGGGGGTPATTVTGGGSGGGAGGPHGAGAAGANGGAGVQNLAGGAGDAGNSPGVSGGSTSGTQWDSLHGVGSGGSSGASTGAGFAGGNFGGAGGGGFSMGSGTPGGPASPGLIVITYSPLLYIPPQGQAQIMA